jgi:hypothetical protein
MSSCGKKPSEEVGPVRAGECDQEAEEPRIARRDLRQHQQSLQEMPAATRTVAPAAEPDEGDDLPEISTPEEAESATKALGPRERFWQGTVAP